MSFLGDAVDRWRRNPKLRSEVVWVFGSKATEFGLLFLLLKLLTNGLGAEGYGEYNLADTSLILLVAVLLVPVHEPFLRNYHASREERHFRSSGLFVLRWYATTTLICAAVLAAFSHAISQEFQLGRWTAAAAGLVFLFDRWRFLGLEVRNLRRERRSWALWNLAYQSTLLAVLVAMLTRPSASPARVLLAFAATAAVFAVPSIGPFLLDVRRATDDRPTPLRTLVGTFGIPFALLIGLQWVQGFSDRYLVKALLDDRSVGLFVAAYQVSGIPFTLLVRVFHNLLTPVAYQRAGSGSDPARVWSADRLLLAGIAVQVAAGLAMLVVYAVFGRRLLVILTNEGFDLSTPTIVALAVGRFLQSISQSLQPIFSVHQSLGRVLAFRAGGAVLTVVLCSFAIRTWGVHGAAVGGALAIGLYGVSLVVGPGGVWWLVTRVRRDASRR